MWSYHEFEIVSAYIDFLGRNYNWLGRSYPGRVVGSDSIYDLLADYMRVDPGRQRQMVLSSFMEIGPVQDGHRWLSVTVNGETVEIYIEARSNPDLHNKLFQWFKEANLELA
ncbi:hypothetical protein BGX26_008651, partial [Mortierella sp. AD094]